MPNRWSLIQSYHTLILLPCIHSRPCLRPFGLTIWAMVLTVVQQFPPHSSHDLACLYTPNNTNTGVFSPNSMLMKMHQHIEMYQARLHSSLREEWLVMIRQA